MHLILVAVSPHDVQRVGADGPGGAQEGQGFHWRIGQYNIEGLRVLRKLRRRVGRQNVTGEVLLIPNFVFFLFGFKDPTLSGAGEDCFRGLLFRG